VGDINIQRHIKHKEQKKGKEIVEGKIKKSEIKGKLKYGLGAVKTMIYK